MDIDGLVSIITSLIQLSGMLAIVLLFFYRYLNMRKGKTNSEKENAKGCLFRSLIFRNYIKHAFARQSIIIKIGFRLSKRFLNILQLINN